jgi:hypothetical protein
VAEIKGENLEWLALHCAGWPFLVLPAGMLVIGLPAAIFIPFWFASD